MGLIDVGEVSDGQGDKSDHEWSNEVAPSASSSRSAMRKGRFDTRYTITIFGISVLLVAAIALTNGQRHAASMGLILGGAMVIGNEWWAWRKRNDE